MLAQEFRRARRLVGINIAAPLAYDNAALHLLRHGLQLREARLQDPPGLRPQEIVRLPDTHARRHRRLANDRLDENVRHFLS